MVLLRSNAQHIYWLGRYLFRIDHVVRQLPLANDQQAAAFAQALYLQIDDAESLNQFMLDRKQPYSLLSQLEIARDNIQELRGLLSAQAYAELNHLIKNAPSDALAIGDIVKQCCAILETEQEEICLFLYIGQNVERIDTYFRFQHNINHVLNTVEPIIERLFHLGWDDLKPSWEILKDQPYLNQFYAFTYTLENQFEVSS
ncbi:alpha-E domain-containing protein [Acinetobacter sp. NIPH 1852]|uniref:alpha-E domain-containing protein n=1 Tax=Acinetobacter sp. NIPH 1852 TaxID=2923428 RepID=UPI001F4A7873|nr:alpha-E domain-containing protein [Acinetobacter sp. NIPH 1852]MCH7308044.1 alpha-E domain-containing protein [Acinetobacter sp. NIPH 1852]